MKNIPFDPQIMYKKYGVVFYKDENTPLKSTTPKPLVDDMKSTLEVMTRMERAKRRGYISLTRGAVVDSGLVDKLLPLLNVVHKEYTPAYNHFNVYFEHESLAIVEEGCVCPYYTVEIEKDSGRWLFKIVDFLGKILFTATCN